MILPECFVLLIQCSRSYHPAQGTLHFLQSPEFSIQSDSSHQKSYQKSYMSCHMHLIFILSPKPFNNYFTAISSQAHGFLASLSPKASLEQGDLLSTSNLRPAVTYTMCLFIQFIRKGFTDVSRKKLLAGN